MKNTFNPKSWPFLATFFLFAYTVSAQIGQPDLNVYQGMGIDKQVNKSLPLSDGTVVIVGDFAFCNQTAIRGVAKLNADGSTNTDFNVGTGTNNVVYALARQADGKLLIGGNFTTFDGTSVNRIARLHVNGTLDTSFRVGTGFDGQVKDIYVNADTSMFVVGSFLTYKGDTVKRIVKLRVDGSRDTSFSAGSSVNGEINAVVVQSDGKVVIGGSFTAFNGTALNRVARLNSNGTADTGFNGAGTGATATTVTDVALLSSGKIVISGSFVQYNGNACRRMAILNTNGSRYTGFGSSVGFDNTVYSITVQPDDKIVAVGDFTAHRNVSINRIIRIDSTATRDTTFNPGAGLNGIGYDVSLDANGKAYVGGSFTQANLFSRISMARFSSTGVLDQTFLEDSKLNNAVSGIGVQSDGKIVLGGLFTLYNQHQANYVCRFNEDGSLDTSFQTGTGANARISCVKVLDNDKVIIAGDFTAFNGVTANRIARLNANGSLDTTFTTGAGLNAYVREFVISDSGKIYIVGDFTQFDGVTQNGITCLNADGTRDTSFQGGTGFDALVSAIRIQPDGKLLVGGDFDYYNGYPRRSMVRIQSNGTVEGTGTFNVYPAPTTTYIK